ncbi:hypothetical protein L1049_019292 [Liquidambar formosana]|uniref:Pentatricopeptide repeat-containing protein n=1 Tax=Liquidambar formosana TaxID=63359 RepID=A0AAP0SBI2_LIQFO
MNLAKLSVSSAVKSSLIHKPIFKTTINLSILETHLHQCQNLRQFNQILSQTILTDFIKDTFAASRLLKFSTDSPFIHIDYSFQIFSHIENPNGFIWNTMMRAYTQRNSPQKVIVLYKLMLEKNVGPDNYTYPILVQASAVQCAELKGKRYTVMF